MSFLILMLLLLRLSFHKAKEPSVTPVDKSGKIFDCHHYNLLVARLNAYGFDRDALKLDISYLKGKKQCACINDNCSNFFELLSGVLQGSILGALLFNNFLNNLFLSTAKASLDNYADNNRLSASSTDPASLMKLLI